MYELVQLKRFILYTTKKVYIKFLFKMSKFIAFYLSSLKQFTSFNGKNFSICTIFKVNTQGIRVLFAHASEYLGFYFINTAI